MEAMEELDTAASEDGVISRFLKRIKRWLVTHSQHLNFFTILVLASVPNPLFDLAGIMCGQFGVRFWKFFLATMIGKAIIKTHIQTVFIISVCNNQLLELVEHRLVWALSHIPGFSSVLPNIIAKLYLVKDKYLTSPVPDSFSSNVEAKQWNLSFTFIWNSLVWIMLLNFFVKNSNRYSTETSQKAARPRAEEANCIKAMEYWIRFSNYQHVIPIDPCQETPGRILYSLSAI